MGKLYFYNISFVNEHTGVQHFAFGITEVSKKEDMLKGNWCQEFASKVVELIELKVKGLLETNHIQGAEKLGGKFKADPNSINLTAFNRV